MMALPQFSGISGSFYPVIFFQLVYYVIHRLLDWFFVYDWHFVLKKKGKIILVIFTRAIGFALNFELAIFVYFGHSL